jgi:hypothetical protein
MSSKKKAVGIEIMRLLSYPGETAWVKRLSHSTNYNKWEHRHMKYQKNSGKIDNTNHFSIDTLLIQDTRMNVTLSQKTRKIMRNPLTR